MGWTIALTIVATIVAAALAMNFSTPEKKIERKVEHRHGVCDPQFRREMSVLLDMPHSATVKALSAADCYVIDDALSFLESRAEVAIHIATLLARRLYYTTTYLVDLQQQAAGRREDLDLVDKILAQLVQSPDEPKAKKRK